MAYIVFVLHGCNAGHMLLVHRQVTLECLRVCVIWRVDEEIRLLVGLEYAKRM